MEILPGTDASLKLVKTCGHKIFLFMINVGWFVKRSFLFLRSLMLAFTLMFFRKQFFCGYIGLCALVERP